MATDSTPTPADGISLHQLASVARTLGVRLERKQGSGYGDRLSVAAELHTLAITIEELPNFVRPGDEEDRRNALVSRLYQLTAVAHAMLG